MKHGQLDGTNSTQIYGMLYEGTDWEIGRKARYEFSHIISGRDSPLQ